MKGLELSCTYYKEICRPVLKEALGQNYDRLAAGLVGNGSECYGFDDELSQDHDFGPRFFIWLTDRDAKTIGEEVCAALQMVPKNFCGYEGSNTSEYGNVGRQGVFRISSYYQMLLGIDHVPRTIAEWRSLGEVNLSIATNGAVFEDEPGEFTSFRNALKVGFPEDLRRKKLAAACCHAAQTGQYNYQRSLLRGELVATRICEAQFMETVMRIVYLLNNEYRPFYKWIHRGLLELAILGVKVHHLTEQLLSAHTDEEHIELIEELSVCIIAELQRQDLTGSTSDFLLDHGEEIQARIQEPTLRAMPAFSEP